MDNKYGKITYDLGFGIKFIKNNMQKNVYIFDVTNINFEELNKSKNYLKHGLNLEMGYTIITGHLKGNLKLNGSSLNIIDFYNFTADENCKITSNRAVYSIKNEAENDVIKIKTMVK